jgi:hypothetical protein
MTSGGYCRNLAKLFLGIFKSVRQTPQANVLWSAVRHRFTYQFGRAIPLGHSTPVFSFGCIGL